MTCKPIEDRLPIYVDGELDAQERVHIELHLETCAACAGLVERLKRTGEALSRIEEIEPSPALLARLREIPATAKRRRLFPTRVLKPSLQPILAGGFMVLAFIAAMVFTPAGGRLLKTIDRQAHAGYSQIEKLYARAESFVDSLDGAKDEIIDSIKTLPPLSRSQE